MEYRVNKIDPELRQKINEERNEDRIHYKKGINLNKDKESTREHKDSKDNNEPQDNDKGEHSKKDEEVKEPFKGNHIDIRR